MRNQIAAAERLGIRAATVNSTNRDEWDAVARPARRGRRRPAADQPRAAQQPAVPRADAAAVHRAGRPARRRRGALRLGLGARLPAGLPPHPRRARARCRPTSPCSARRRRRTTASSPTSSEQFEVGADARAPHRLPRPARARVAAARGRRRCPPPADRLAWLATWLPRCPARGSSTASPSATPSTVAEWLRAHGISAVAYSGEVTDEERVEAEHRLLAQRGQGRRRDERARHGLRQARPRLRRALPGAVVGHRLLPAGRPRRPRRRRGARGAAARPRGPRASRTSSSSTAFPPRERSSSGCSS